MARAASILVLGLVALACARVTRAPEPPPAASARLIAPASRPAAPSPDRRASTDGGADAKAPDPLLDVRLSGPENGLADLCGPKCRVLRTLPAIAPFGKVMLAVGSDPLNPQNVNVTSTYIVFEADDGWYGAVILRVGSGTQDVEMVNPRNSGMPPFGHMHRPVHYSGQIRRVRAIEDQATKQKLVAAELTRSDGLPLDVLLLCGADGDGRPVCGELRTESALAGYRVKNGVVDVTWQSGESAQFVVSWRDE